MKDLQSECKNIELPMKDKDKSTIANWKSQDNTLSPIKATQQCDENGAKKIILETNTKRGSQQDKQDLIHAGICLATGARSSDFGLMLLNSCLSAGGINLDQMDKHEAEKTLNAILDTLHSLKPNDEVEGMLVMRLISLNLQISNFMTLSLSEGQSIEGEELYINRSTKLSRLFNETLEALMRYRRKGEQKVVVQHVNVNDGGRAIVGNFEAGGGGNKNSGGTP
ncbi:MAG: hypothetical protein ACH350_09130 [Parachlamydiaceae bacterium]